MTREDVSRREVSRRTVLKTSAAVGAATTGIAAFGGTAAAQQRQLEIDASDIGEGLIVIQNVEILENVDVTVEDITVRVQDINVEVLTFEETTIEGDQVGLINVEVTDSLNNILNRNTVNVLVQILSGTGRFVGRDSI